MYKPLILKMCKETENKKYYINIRASKKLNKTIGNLKKLCIIFFETENKTRMIIYINNIILIVNVYYLNLFFKNVTH